MLRHYYFGDFARKVVGVGSVGTEAFILLLLGDRPDEPLFLQLKEAQESVLAPFAGPSEYKHQGERVVRGQKLMQAAGDPFLGWTSGLQVDGAAAKEYYVRQLRDMKGAMNVPAMDPPQLTYYAGLCGWALARAHARTGRAAMISGYLGSSDQFDRAIEEFAVAYADRTNSTTSGCSTRSRPAAAHHRRSLTAERPSRFPSEAGTLQAFLLVFTHSRRSARLRRRDAHLPVFALMTSFTLSTSRLWAFSPRRSTGVSR